MRTNLACLIAVTAMMAVPLAAYGQNKPRLNPAHVMGFKACTECHGKEVDAWKATHHYKTFNTLEESDLANDILDNLDIDDPKSESNCIKCHFTLKGSGAGKAISGISCESCHGAAKDWLQEHNKKSATRAQRQAASVKGGMIYPADIHAVASNCFDCHVVDDPELVDKGGHPPYSEGFDLYSWSQGEVRHSFMKPGTPVKEAGTTNRAADANFKRKLFMVGKLLNLEYSLRALAKSPRGSKKYAAAHNKHYRALLKEITELNAIAKTDEVTAILAAAKAVKGSTMLSTAKKISEEADKFAKAHDGSKLAGIDSRIPSKVKGTVFK